MISINLLVQFYRNQQSILVKSSVIQPYFMVYCTYLINFFGKIYHYSTKNVGKIHLNSIKSCLTKSISDFIGKIHSNSTNSFFW